MKADSSCPCGAGPVYAQCCGRWHAGAPAPTAEALMRSRYTAFVLGLGDYLLASWHPDTRPATLQLDAGLNWLGLHVKAHRQLAADEALVEFVARCRQGGGRAERLHEVSRFLRRDGHWLYVEPQA